MTTAEWATILSKRIFAKLDELTMDPKRNRETMIAAMAEYLDDEIEGYCDGCEFAGGGGDREREPTAAEEAMHYGEDRG